MPRKSAVPAKPEVGRTAGAGLESRRAPRRERRQRVGFAWYTARQWARLRAIAADTETLYDSYDRWSASAERLEAALARGGVDVERILVDVDALAARCLASGRVLDGRARSEYVAAVMRRLAARSHGDLDASAGP